MFNRNWYVVGSTGYPLTRSFSTREQVRQFKEQYKSTRVIASGRIVRGFENELGQVVATN